VYDIAFLIRDSEFEKEQKALILERLIKKSQSRGFTPEQDSMGDLEVKKRSEKEWESIKLEVEDLPSFDGEFEVVESFYRSLPWEGFGTRT